MAAPLGATMPADTEAYRASDNRWSVRVTETEAHRDQT